MGFNKKFFTTAGIVASSPSGSSGDITNMSLSATKTIVAGSQGNPRGIFMSVDGTRIFTSHKSSGQNWFNQYNFGTAFDVSTITTVQKTFQETQASIPDYLTGLCTSNDNSWISFDPYSTNNYYRRPFGTAGDLSTLGTLGTGSCSRGGGDRVSASQCVSHDGTKLFITSTYNIRRYTLNTPNDFSSQGTGCGTTYSSGGIVTDMGASCRGIGFNLNGTRMYVFGDNRIMGQYDLSTAYDPSTRSNFLKKDLSSVISTNGTMRSVQLNLDASHLYVCMTESKQIHDFTL
jgi:hypothetical protein